MDWDLFRVQLGMPYQAGSWFIVSEDVVRVDRNVPGKHRPVIWPGVAGAFPLVYPRSTSGRGLRHRAHTAFPQHGSCRINRPGAILLKLPRTMPASALGADSFSCVEPDDDVIAKVVAAGPR